MGEYAADFKGNAIRGGWLKKQMLGPYCLVESQVGGGPLSQGGEQRQLCCGAGSSRLSIAHLFSIAD
jgi:hypothetical protein